MNRSTTGFLLSKAYTGFFQFKEAEGLSPNTLKHYRHDLNAWLVRHGDVSVDSVTTEQLRAYLTYLRRDYVPRRASGKNDTPLSGKTIRNVWVVLCAFFSWIELEFKLQSPMRGVPAPKFEKTEVLPFTREQIEALLKGCELTAPANTRDRRIFTMPRVTANRDRAIIKVLLDSGLRANELCMLDVRDYDPQTGEIRVRFGKGGKGRYVYIDKNTRRDVWRYLAHREDGEDPEAPLFTGTNDRRMNNTSLRLLLTRLGDKVGVAHCHPHRFRHTFAIEFLRAGGDVFSLQRLLGHSTLDMVKNYVAIAQVDVRNAHRKASPVAHWRL